MLPMKVEIGKNFKGCLSSFDIITKNYQGKYRHHEPFEKISGWFLNTFSLISKKGKIAQTQDAIELIFR